jgi:hypothetical protein
MTKPVAVAILAALAAAALTVNAQDLAPAPQDQKAALFCPRGFAATYTVQCDVAPPAEGSNPLARLGTPDGAHLSICTATPPTCQPIRDFDSTARAGHEVLDSAEGDLVIVGFGLDRLLGVAP